MSWTHIQINGLFRPDGTAYPITIYRPTQTATEFRCRVIIPNVVDTELCQETEFLAVEGAMSFVKQLVQTPAPLIVSETTLKSDSFPILTVAFF